LTTPSQISELLADQVDSLARELLPHGKREGHEWCAGDVSGGPGKSLKVQLVGERKGLWKDFATGEDGGDMLDLWAAARCNGNLGEAIKQAKLYLGIREPQFETGTRRTYVVPEKPVDLRAVKAAGAAGKFLAGRGLSDAVIARYKVATSHEGSAVVFPYFDSAGVLVHLSYRGVSDKKFWTSKGTRPSLFGWQAIPATERTVVLTEGQLDAMAMAMYGYPALSIPFGAGKGHYDWITEEWDALERFDTIYLAFDNDDAGKAATSEVLDRLGRHRCRVVDLPYKDANDCLMQKVAPDVIRAAMRGARTMDPGELKIASGYTEEVYLEFHPPNQALVGFMPPWSRLGNQFQFRYGETTVLAGSNGHGKSEGAGHIVLSALAQSVRCCVASLEFRPRKWLARLARQALCSFTPERDRLAALDRWYGDKLWVFDVVGRASPERMLECFLYAYRRHGVKLFVIDNMSKLGIAEDDYNRQKEFIEQATAFSVEHNVHIIVVAHMRKGDGSHDFEKGGKWGIKGSGAITDLVDNVLIWWRNKPKENRLQELALPVRSDSGESEESRAAERAELREKPDTVCEVEKQRNGSGEEPRQTLWFNKESHQFVERLDHPPMRYL
jgi:twinkle protein